MPIESVIIICIALVCITFATVYAIHKRVVSKLNERLGEVFDAHTRNTSKAAAEAVGEEINFIDDQLSNLEANIMRKYGAVTGVMRLLLRASHIEAIEMAKGNTILFSLLENNEDSSYLKLVASNEPARHNKVGFTPIIGPCEYERFSDMMRDLILHNNRIEILKGSNHE